VHNENEVAAHSRRSSPRLSSTTRGECAHGPRSRRAPRSCHGELSLPNSARLIKAARAGFTVGPAAYGDGTVGDCRDRTVRCYYDLIHGGNEIKMRGGDGSFVCASAMSLVACIEAPLLAVRDNRENSDAHESCEDS
jgi:hypothetical protein